MIKTSQRSIKVNTAARWSHRNPVEHNPEPVEYDDKPQKVAGCSVVKKQQSLSAPGVLYNVLVVKTFLLLWAAELTHNQSPPNYHFPQQHELFAENGR